jgi:uncharacterized protein (DUF983 family)
MEDHEAPSEEDLERFSGVTRMCPECREEVYDDAEVCYHCGHVFSATDDKPLPKWAVVTAAVSVVGLLVAMLLM